MATSTPHPVLEDHAGDLLEDLRAFVCEIHAASGAVLSVGRLAESLLGYSAETWTSQPDFLATHIHPEDRAYALEGIRKSAAKQVKLALDFRMLHAQGHSVWFRVAARPPANPALPLTLVFSDISPHKRTEEALRESRRRYRHLVDHARDIIFRTDLRGRITFFNSAATRLLRYPAEDLLGRHFARLVRPDFRRKVRRFYERQFHDRAQTSYFEAPVRTAEGATLWLGQNVQLVVEDGAAVGFQGIARDLTDQKRVEERLRESEERYRIVAESATDAILTFDERGSIIFVNHACEKIFGYAVEEMIGRPLSKLLPDCPRRFSQSFAWVDLTTGQSYLGTETVQIPGLHRNGSDLVLEATIGEFLERGRHQFTAVLRDITERHRAAEALRRSDERFRSLIENASDLIAILDHEGRVLYASPSVRRILDVAAGEVEGTPALAWVHPGDHDAVRRVFHEQLASAQTAARQFECRLLRRDGAWRVVEAIGRNLMGEPAVQGYVCNLRDITDRTQAQEELRAANETLRAIIQTSPLAILTVDAERRLSKWNSAAERMFGWAEQEVLGKEPPFISREQRAEAASLFERLRQGQSFTVDTYRQRRSGEMIPVAISAAPMVAPDGRFCGAVAILADLTDRLRLEERLRQAQKMEAVGQLAGGIAHDFNNLLTVIHGYGQLLLNSLDSASRPRAHAREIMNAADRASALIRQLLTFSRRQAAQPRVVDLNVLAAGLLPMLFGLAGPAVRIEQRFADAECAVCADPVQLEQILFNLVANARDAMPAGGQILIETAIVRLTAGDLRAQAGAEPGEYVQLSISDTGMGMSEEVRRRLFEPFFTTKEPGKGTGLGLATVYGIVQQNRGHIEVSSEPGAGSVFRICLPRATPPFSAGCAAAGEPELRGTETILLFEQDEALRGSVSELLRELGYRVFAVGARAEAETICRQWPSPVDLLVTDLARPEDAGKDLYLALRELRPEMRVLYMTDQPDETLIRHGLLPQSDHVLRKPISHRALGLSVRQVLDAPPPAVPAP
jgi:two-component system cell cycle sensor histidine kinase/response regulator CckA